jgi:16S rRNA (uracil1498-N3)-methyltransferase
VSSPAHSTAPRISVPSSSRVHEPVVGFRLEGGEFKHAIRVLRLEVGDAVRVVDGTGVESHCCIDAIEGRWAFARLVSEQQAAGEPTLHLTLCCALLKGDKLDWVLQKGTEVGVARFVLFEGLRSVKKRPKGRASQAESDAVFAGHRSMSSCAPAAQRWQRIVAGAAAQCGRAVPPEVLGPLDFTSAVQLAARAERGLLLYEGEGCERLSVLLAGAPPPASLACVVGPEGGFDAREVACARDAGLQPATLGRRILRSETAAVVVPALMLSLCHELG